MLTERWIVVVNVMLGFRLLWSAAFYSLIWGGHIVNALAARTCSESSGSDAALQDTRDVDLEWSRRGVTPQCCSSRLHLILIPLVQVEEKSVNYILMTVCLAYLRKHQRTQYKHWSFCKWNTSWWHLCLCTLIDPLLGFSPVVLF